MKFLHISDLHLGKLLYQYSLLPDQEFWCNMLVEHLQQEHYDAVVLAGDLFDRSVPPAEAVALLDTFLSRLVLDCKVPVLAVSGNHDSPRRLAFGSRLYQAGGLTMAAVPQKQITKVTLTDSFGEVEFFLLPYVSPADGKTLFPELDIKSFGDTYAALLQYNAEQIDPGRRNVLVAHGFFGGSKDDNLSDALRCDSEVEVGGLDLVNSALIAGFDYAALGHLHAPQQAGGEHLRYSGSPLPYSLSEEHQNKCVYSVELGEKGQLSVTPVQLPSLRKLRSVSGTLEELLAPTEGGFASSDYVFVNLIADETTANAAEKLRNVYPNYLAIRYVSQSQGELLLSGESAASRTLSQAFADFCAQIAGEALTEAQLAIIEELSAQKAGDRL